MDKHRPTYTCIYFTAKWNPTIPHIEKDYDNLTKTFNHFTHVKVDCDQVPQLKRFFDCRVEPAFTILINGAEINKIVGFNFDKLHYSLEQAQSLHQTEFNYVGGSDKTWERFYDSFDRWARAGEYDRDTFRIVIDDQMDRHRGSGQV